MIYDTRYMLVQRVQLTGT